MTAIPFDRFTAEVLSLYQPPLRAAQTYRVIRQVLGELATLPSVHTTGDLTAPAIAEWIRSKPERSAARWLSLLRTSRAVVSWAVSLGYLELSPFRARRVSSWVRADVAAPAVAPRRRHLSIGQVRSLLALLDREAATGSWKAGRLQALVYTYAYLGLRKCEALHLRPEDIDLDARTLTIRPKADWRPKTLASAAVLPIPAPLAVILASWRHRCGGAWLFPGARLRTPWTGGMPGRRALDEIKAAGVRAGIDGLTILAFRKTLATAAKMWGISPLELKAILRHTSISTQAYYDEDDVEILRPTMDKIRFD